MKTDYARILTAIADAKGEKAAVDAVGKLVEHLKSRGRVRMLAKILGEVRAIAARRKALAPVVEVAKKDEEEYALREARARGIEAKHAVVHDALVSGWRARKEGVVIDHSGKSALISIYTAAVSGS